MRAEYPHSKYNITETGNDELESGSTKGDLCESLFVLFRARQSRTECPHSNPKSQNQLPLERCATINSCLQMEPQTDDSKETRPPFMR